MATPPEMARLRMDIGWPALYLRALEQRLDLEDFRLSGKDEGLDDIRQWWQDNELDEESSLGHMDALIYGRSYITVAAPGEDDDQDSPIIRLESPLSMYAEMDPRTRKVTRALRIYQAREATGEPERATLLLPNETLLLVRAQGAASQWTTEQRIPHNLGEVPVVPIVHGAKLSNRYGTSVLTPEIRAVTDAAARLMMNLQAAEELMAVPLRLVFGVEKSEIAPNGSKAELEEMYYGRLAAFANEAGSAFQFSAADLRNFTDVMGELSRQFASYTGLPPQYLAFNSDNPASAEAIQASEIRLVKTVERTARQFGGSWERAMRLAMRVMKRDVPEDFRRLEAVWRDPSTPTLASKADAYTKLATAKSADGRPIVPVEMVRIELGYTDEQRQQMDDWDKESSASQLAKMLAAPTVPGPPGQPVKPGPSSAVPQNASPPKKAAA
ncbi:phage portal protein [Nocardia ninae]|nr:phage portal protein [Nocardia ninae]